jgi:hypothetical protein
MEPDFEKQKFVKKLIKNPAFGELSGTNSLVHVTGFTAAFLLTLPELFVQWRDHEDGDESNKKQHEVLEFLGQQCHWPSFSDEKVQRTSSPKVAHGEGSTLPNAKSLPPCSFLPNLFDLTKVFKDCLDGSTEWETRSLCEETKMIESSPRKRPAEPTEDPAEEQPSAKLARRQLAEKGEEEQEEESGDAGADEEEEKSGSEEPEVQDDEKSDTSPPRRRRTRKDATSLKC